jgi:hypothetical protein
VRGSDGGGQEKVIEEKLDKDKEKDKDGEKENRRG